MSGPQRRRPLSRLAYRPEEAAEVIGVSRAHFYRYVIGDLKVVYSGRVRLVPAVELERWLDRNAAVHLPDRAADR